MTRDTLNRLALYTLCALALGALAWGMMQL